MRRRYLGQVVPTSHPRRPRSCKSKKPRACAQEPILRLLSLYIRHRKPSDNELGKGQHVSTLCLRGTYCDAGCRLQSVVCSLHCLGIVCGPAQCLMSGLAGGDSERHTRQPKIALESQECNPIDRCVGARLMVCIGADCYNRIGERHSKAVPCAVSKGSLLLEKIQTGKARS